MAEREKPIEIINPPNMLKVKLGGKLPAVDENAIKRAEQAIEQMSVEFADWLGEEVDKLEEAYGRAKGDGMNSEAGEDLFTVAHDLRGLGTTYEYPIVTRMAASLARLVETEQQREEIPIKLVDAHVKAIRAALIQNIRNDDNAVGAALAEELEVQVVELVGEPN